jgi:gluconate 2-dehydrogenase gamma chain
MIRSGKGVISLKRRTFRAISCLSTAPSCSRSSKRSVWRVLSDSESRTLEAWVECLIPTDQDPGAKDAGVVRFIDSQLAGRLKHKYPSWQAAIAGVNRAAEMLHSRLFADLDISAQTELVKRMEAGKAPKEAFPEDGGKAAFELLLLHTMMGFYGNPRHGGNQDYVSWKMLGIPPVPIRGRRHNSPDPSQKKGGSKGLLAGGSA